MRSAIPFILSLGSLAAAISITEPTLNSTYAAGSTITVNWTTVDTDPTTFSLYLWNFVYWPPSYVPLALDIPTSDLSYPVQIPCDTDPEWGYQISGINGTNVYIIYAQSEKFFVSDVANATECVDTSVTAPGASASSTCPAASTVYVTVSPTASSSALFHHNHHHDHHLLHHHSSHLPAPSSTPAPVISSRTVKPGIVPKTIGWCSDYSHPVTLDKVPTPTVALYETETASHARTQDVSVVTATTTVSVVGNAGGDGCPFA
ncbi:extracellular proline-serine rich protein [Aspergillus welwitschiae]|uniref:Extracellular proline-serine rich protein n=1 Tax=Aspergillus welwitschiae TaxID=1341132 RepID=A0A3F3PM60_9EURO|nr:extracellular proline-serine rich protein [Aspergillus welwitschiae]RDH27997.1 extracellular proline-serine rich protein [Aspergillus welwitschiae]